MPTTSSIHVLCALVACIFAFQASPSVAETDQNDTCTWAFEATVRMGANTGMSFAGTLTVEIDAQGVLSGSLTTNDDQIIPVVGPNIEKLSHGATCSFSSPERRFKGRW